MDLLDPLDRKDHKDLLASEANLAAMAFKDHKDHKDHQAMTATLVHKEVQEIQARADLRENQVQLENATTAHNREPRQVIKQCRDLHLYLLLLIFTIITQNWPLIITTTKWKS